MKGICIWFTGLSGSGKTTTAEALRAEFIKSGRTVTMLDGDEVREHLSAGLDFSRAGRDANVLRLAYVASEIVKHGGIVICAAISPYAATRAQARVMIGTNFIEVYAAAPLAVCEERDPKGLYARARRGEIKSFTGVDDPYEAPERADVVLQTDGSISLDSNVARLMSSLSLGDSELDDDTAKAPTALVLGRFQPPHPGHLGVVYEALRLEGRVCIGVRESLGDEKNPFPFEEVRRRWLDLLAQNGLSDVVTVVRLPNITNVVYGRDVGYKITKVSLDAATEAISATKIRQGMSE
jgi:adenylyl-sulfate kinase